MYSITFWYCIVFILFHILLLCKVKTRNFSLFLFSIQDARCSTVRSLFHMILLDASYISILDASQSSTHTVIVWSLAVVVHAEWDLASSCWNNRGFPGIRRHLDGTMCLCKISYLRLSYVVTGVWDSPALGYWCTIPWLMLAFVASAWSSLTIGCGF